MFSVCEKWSEVLSFLIIAVWWVGHNFDCSFTYWILQFSIRNSLHVASSKLFVKFCFSILYNMSLSLSYCVKCFKITFLCFSSVSLCFECSGWWNWSSSHLTCFYTVQITRQHQPTSGFCLHSRVKLFCLVLIVLWFEVAHFNNTYEYFQCSHSKWLSGCGSFLFFVPCISILQLIPTIYQVTLFVSSIRIKLLLPADLW